MFRKFGRMHTVIRTVLLASLLFSVSAIAQLAPSPESQRPPTAEVTKPAATELICRSTVETGSLVRRRKACFTRKQWTYIDQEHSDEARKLMMDNMGKISNP